MNVKERREGATPEALLAMCAAHLGKARAWKSVLRLKWIRNSVESTQHTEDEIIDAVAKETFSNL